MGATMAIIGDLEIRLRADIARLQRDMDQARQSVSGAMGHIGRAAGVAAAALAAVGVGLSVAAFSGFIRGAIDAADAASKLSAKIGVSVRDVAGLELAYKLSGLSGEALTTTMARLSTGIASGNKGLEALAIQTRNADGTFKGTKETLYSVADAFKGLDDGSQKTALAVQLFGKAGADMIPLLNGGSQGLREMDEMAAKLGLTISEKTAKDAEAFNDTLDLVKLGGQGVANGIAAQLLPTLNNLAGSFLESMTSGDKLKKTADFLAASMKILYTVGVGIVTAFSAVGKTLGAAGAQVVALLSGDFKIAAQIGRDWASDMNTDFKDSAKQISDAWSTTGNETVATLAALSKKTKVIAEDDGKAKKAASDAAKLALKEEADAYKAVMKLAQERANLRNKEYDDINAYLQSQQEGYSAAVKGSKDALKAAQDEYAQFGMSKSQIAEITLLTLESTEAKYLDGSAGAIAAQQQIDAQRELIAVMRGTEGLEADKKANEEKLTGQKKMWESIDQTAHDTFISIFDSGKSAFDRLRDTLKNGLLDLLYSMTLKKWIISIGASVTGGAVSGMASAADTAGGIGNATSMLSGVQSAYSAIQTGFAGISSSVASGVQSGMNFVSGSGGYMGQGPMQISSTASGIGTAAGYAGGIAAGQVIGRTISGGYSAIGGKSGSTAVNVGTAIGAIWGPLGAAIGGAIGGLVNRAFGMGEKKVKAQGIEGSFGAGGFDGNTFQDWKQDGGWFRSDKKGHATSALDAETQKQLTGGFDVLKSVSADFAKSLGLDATSIANYSEKISLTLTNDAAKNQEAIAKLFSDMGDHIATAVAPAIASFAKDGETSSVTLQRLSVSLSAANGMLDTLNLKLYDTSLAGGAMASSLVDLFGGLQNMQSVSAGYFQSFYSEQEKVDIATRQLGKTFSDLGFVMPVTNAELRKQIEAQDLTTEAGRKSYAQLMGLSGAFASLTGATDQLAQSAKASAQAVAEAAQAAAEAAKAAALEAAKAAADAAAQAYDDAKSATNAALQAVQRAIDAEKSRIGVIRDVAAESVRSITTVFDLLKDQVSQLYGTVGGTSAMQAAQGNAFIDNALQNVLSTGYLPDQKELQGAITAARGGLDASQFATQIEADRAALVMAGKLSQMQTAGGYQLTAAERSLQIANEQLDALDAQLTYAQQQVDALNGINASVLSVTAAIAGLAAAMAAQKSVAATPVGGTVSMPSNPSVAYEGMGSDITTIQDLYTVNLGRVGDAAGMDYWSKEFMADGVISAQEKQAFALAAMPEYKAKYGFEVGTNYVPYDMVAQIHEGEAIVPRAYNPAAGGNNNAELLEELRAQRAENREMAQRLDAALYAIAKNTMQTADTIDTWDGAGMPTERTA